MHFLIVAPHGKDVELDRCVQCSGVWFDAGEVEQVYGKSLPFEPFDHEADRSCPVCDQPLQAGVLKKAVPVERCGKCRGVFLDQDDLKLLNLKLADRPKKATMVNGFVCAKCGGRFPYAEGNGTNKGLVCKSCVVNPATEKLKPGEHTGLSHGFGITAGADWGDDDSSLGTLFDFFFD
jgi:Zn-finger nucleic acid-binding protein